MKIKNLILANFVGRPNRFTVVVERDGYKFRAHLRDPGRLEDLLNRGNKLLLKHIRAGRNRKTCFDVIATFKDGEWVLINSGLHNSIAMEIIGSRFVKELEGYKVIKREYKFGESRLDFLLGRDGEKMLLEVKGCTLLKGDRALFPDAPTSRGKRHLEELMKATELGFKSSILFLIFRRGARIFSPNYDIDQRFAKTLKESSEKGVIIIPVTFKTRLNKDFIIKPGKRIKTIL
ncbi:MAG TPA: DNA/RNA nuclease SfsA [Methanothermobacter sp.]|jgi:sugar fermentation stimulation protein A|uniref:Sugar fermentation stimulation protein homolog n=1 Tax=Methanothermobacter tenebrarum TaxID=680118 RepID=A0ABN6PD46_9EURY|nr:DNA/RNA nuclease SfsA [Methanothermobacter tenebrarum]MDD3454171.1 DNA/RNA nuclease SfsA [Methanobacteriales archaeon]MDX9693751.1 DNA/RNA nuclease SfsA [Methanothermobacter sp.]BDH80129.1 sugar fermentation stimulation protein SfsA [Methanothermobacter tenebrarum]HHW17276.1 DNA/RNA nuclease SfsA [Methanothermobacter sp.]HOQ20573.1 DNA/RNA nuclease SfsA [Methanothermobacter sp.]